MKKKMEDYEKHWERKKAIYFEDRSDILSGVACPECGEELRINSAFTLLSNPPKYHAWCNKCDWKGYL